MTPIFASDRLDWASALGLFILNFGVLDLLVQDFLEDHLPPEEFARWRERHFANRIERIRQHVQPPGYPANKREQFERWASRLERIRKTRNHIAHGLVRVSLAEDKKTWSMTASLPRGLDASDSPAALHLTFEDLVNASRSLTALIEDFKAWSGGWVTDGTIRW